VDDMKMESCLLQMSHECRSEVQLRRFYPLMTPVRARNRQTSQRRTM